ncbi:carbohydrate ABC transporter permease [Caldicoprobacter algeriensis]|uniref:carbohydrate ABC transporter permease n=1 Tax=Caldicoprobacter algeriensis TaxID=699281 RepID=UPI00207A82E1|nr:carbohydrate ABC transporter permease [Caldicoprobacter algeriensis]MCM8901464.1 carbohydrate ABC transporter permease [Caldicoprobacter algeriensis]
MKKSLGEKIFDWVNGVLLTVMAASMVYPFIYVLAISLNEAADSNRGGIFFLPRKFTLDSYRIVFENNDLVNAALVSVGRTVIGTVLTVLCSAMFAYVFTKPEYIIYKPMKVIFFMAMFLGGGALIPVYMLYRSLGLLNSFAVYIIPYLVNLWFVILFRTYYIQLPKALEEAALIDGANELRIFFTIILPLSTPMIATIALFAAVDQWNSWRDTLFFTSKESLKTLQFVMMEVMQKAQARTMITRAAMKMQRIRQVQTADPVSVRMAITIVTTVPIVCVYPFLQKYFIKGMLVGSMKG